MKFAKLTRPDSTPVFVNADFVATVAAAPKGGSNPEAATRVLFQNGAIQDVMEDATEVAGRLSAEAVLGAPLTATVANMGLAPQAVPVVAANPFAADFTQPFQAMFGSVQPHPGWPGDQPLRQMILTSVQPHPGWPNIAVPGQVVVASVQPHPNYPGNPTPRSPNVDASPATRRRKTPG